MENNVNKVLDGISRVLVCDNTLDGCDDCPYYMDCVPAEMINVPRKMLQDASKVLAQYGRFAYKTFVSVGIDNHAECSICGYSSDELSNTNVLWCPHCGARFV